MQAKMIKCPKDAQVMYSREVCENVFRKGNIRTWCKTCEIFQDKEGEADQRQAQAG